MNLHHYLNREAGRFFSAAAKFFAVTATVWLTACANQAPQVSEDGLVLTPSNGPATVYIRPGATLSGYDEFGLGACEVSFKRNWMRNQNSNTLDLSSRVTQKDVDRIKDSLAAECDQFLREALLQDPAYKLVETFADGEAVLIIRPAITNLDVAAPNVQSTGIRRTYTTSAGEMTLNLELIDGTTGEVLVRAYDRKRGPDSSFMQWSNSVTNRAEADRMLKAWAERLRAGLDQALAQP